MQTFGAGTAPVWRQRRCSWTLTHHTHCHGTLHCSLHHARAQRTASPAESQRADHSHPQRLPLCRVPLSSAQTLSRGRLDVPCGDLDAVFVHRPSEREPPPPAVFVPRHDLVSVTAFDRRSHEPCARRTRGLSGGPSALSLALGPYLYFVAQFARERVPLQPRCTIVRPRHPTRALARRVGGARVCVQVAAFRPQRLVWCLHIEQELP